MIKPWPKLSSTPKGDFRIFQIRSDVKTSPRTGREHDFYVLECVNWVNVVAVTPDDHIVMVEQFRHGSETVELEVPGGMMNVGEPDPVGAGCRELREETGYEGDAGQLIGQVFPNPAIQNNICYTAMVPNCTIKHATEFDHGEDIVTRLVPVKDIPGLIATGKIKHSLVIVALYHYELWKRKAGQ